MTAEALCNCSGSLENPPKGSRRAGAASPKLKASLHVPQSLTARSDGAAVVRKASHRQSEQLKQLSTLTSNSVQTVARARRLPRSSSNGEDHHKKAQHVSHPKLGWPIIPFSLNNAYLCIIRLYHITAGQNRLVLCALQYSVQSVVVVTSPVASPLLVESCRAKI